MDMRRRRQRRWRMCAKSWSRAEPLLVRGRPALGTEAVGDYQDQGAGSRKTKICGRRGGGGDSLAWKIRTIGGEVVGYSRSLGILVWFCD